MKYNIYKCVLLVLKSPDNDAQSVMVHINISVTEEPNYKFYKGLFHSATTTRCVALTNL